MFSAQGCTRPSVRKSLFPCYESSMCTNWNIPDTKHSEGWESCRERRRNYSKSLTIHHLKGATQSVRRKSMEKFEKRKLCGSFFAMVYLYNYSCRFVRACLTTSKTLLWKCVAQFFFRKGNKKISLKSRFLGQLFRELLRKKSFSTWWLSLLSALVCSRSLLFVCKFRRLNPICKDLKTTKLQTNTYLHTWSFNELLEAAVNLHLMLKRKSTLIWLTLHASLSPNQGGNSNADNHSLIWISNWRTVWFQWRHYNQ